MPPGAAEQRVRERYERLSSLCELERPDDTTAVVRVDSRRGHRVELAESGVRSHRPGFVVEPLPTRAYAGRWRRRQLELGERGSEVQSGPSHDDRRPPGLEDVVDRRVREWRVLAHRRDVRERPDSHESLRLRRPVREDRQAVVDLHRVGRDDLGREQLRDGRGDLRFPAGGRPEQADDEHGSRRRRARAARRRASSTLRSRSPPTQARRERSHR